jgi:TRAP transporter 4TM/12TM fusion protein
MRVAGMILIGFIIFGVALQASGGGEFFLNLSYCILGATRGGTAKVAVLSSALFGSLSGSVISNVITTGSITIPAIKKSGYPPHYAGGIECAASTGGVLMPPVMGATAFVMAAFLSISYGKIALAAAIPSILAYIGLLIQVDGYAARQGLTGLPKSQLPSLKAVMLQGWFYLGAVAVLLYFLFALRLESQAPFISILFLLAFAMIRKETRFTLKTFLAFIQSTGKLLSELIAILSGVGMILGALALTGVAAAFAREIVSMAGGNLVFMLVLGAFASFVLGMGMTITACYVFLALVLAPALEMMGLNQIAVHLYVMYWGMLSYITPPVALAAYPAAVIAGSRPIKVGLVAMKLGAVKYLVPLFFVLDPALVMQADSGAILQAFITATIGVLLIGSVLEGYLIGLGKIELTTIGGIITGVALFISGSLLSLPGLKMDLIGIGLMVITVTAVYIYRATKKTDPIHSS